MGRNREKGGKAKKKRRRRREEYARTHDKNGRYSLHTPLKKEPGTNVFPKGLQDILLTDEPELNAEELRLRAIERAKEDREKGDEE